MQKNREDRRRQRQLLELPELCFKDLPHEKEKKGEGRKGKTRM